MTKDKTLHRFFSGFGIAAYPVTSVVNEDGEPDVQFPYLTYDLPLSAFEQGEVSMTVNLWYRTGSEAIPNAKAAEISAVIGQGGVVLPCDGGYIWLKRGTPFCQSLEDQADRMIKRRYINITVEYLTEN